MRSQRQHCNIKFESVFEGNNSFASLDIKITRIDNKLVVSVFRKSTFSGVFSLILKAFYLLITSFAYSAYYFTDASLFVLQVKNNLRSCNHKIYISREGISSTTCSQMYKILFKMSFFVPEKVLQMIARKETLLVLPFLGLLYFQHRTGLQKCFIPFQFDS